MSRYFIEVQYNGTAFHGSQIQGVQTTVQFELNKALSKFFRRSIDTLGASRTDEGVHALCNIYQVDMEENIERKVIYNLNSILPHSISIQNIYGTSNPSAHARFDAISRQYRYRIYTQKNPFLYQRAFLFPYKIDLELLQETAKMLMGYNDFEAFSKKNTQSHTFQCTLLKSEWQIVENELHYVVWGNRFLRGMVRALVGTQLRVAKGKYTLQDFKEIIEGKDCSKSDFSVPGYGLYLEKINYPKGLLLPLS